MHKYSLHILFLFSLFIRIVYAFYLSDDIFAGDAKGYYDHTLYLLGQAQQLDFKWISFWSPGESLYLLPWIFVFGKAKWVVVSSMLAVWATFFYLFEKWAAFFLQAKTRLYILLIFSIFPTFVHHSVVPLTHLTATSFMLTVFYLLYQKKAFSPIKTGALMGFLLLIRPAMLLLGLIFPFLIQSKKQIFLSFFISFLMVGAWSVFLYKKTNTFIFISESNAYNLYMGNHPETPKYATWWWATHTWEKGSVLKRETDSLLLLPAGQIGKNFQPLALHYIKQYPLDFAQRSLNRIRCLFAFDTFTGSMLAEKHCKSLAFAVIAIDGIFYMLLMGLFILSFLLSKQALSMLNFQLAAIFLISLPYFFSFSHPTYHFSILPIVAIGAGIFWENKYFSWKKTSFLRKVIVAFLLLFFIFIQIEWLYFWVEMRTK